jgi:hypothetical protein
MNSADFLGLEYEWVAVDCNGHLGYFATAGYGHAPGFFTAHVSEHEQIVDRLLALPLRGVGVPAGDLPEDAGEPWKALADRGVFGFDAPWGYYKRVYQPSSALHVSELPDDLQTFFRTARVPGACWETASTVPDSVLIKRDLEDQEEP